jgi:DNA polymerase-3 subunit beta
MDVRWQIDVGADGKEDGDMTVPTQLFYDTIRLGGETFTLTSQKESKATITTSSGEYILTVDNQESSPTGEPDWEKLGCLPAEQFADMVHRTSFAAATNDVREYLNGVVLQSTGMEIVVTATDAKQLVRCKYRALMPCFDLIVPVHTMDMLASVVNGDVTIYVDAIDCPSRIKFEAGAENLTSRLINEMHPDYGMLVPKNCEKRVSVSRQELLDAARRVRLYNNTLTLTVEKTRIVLRARDEYGDAEEVVPCDGDEFEIAFNGRFLAEMLEHLDKKVVTFELASSKGAVAIRDGGHVLMLLMPIRLCV